MLSSNKPQVLEIKQYMDNFSDKPSSSIAFSYPRASRFQEAQRVATEALHNLTAPGCYKVPRDLVINRAGEMSARMLAVSIRGW